MIVTRYSYNVPQLSGCRGCTSLGDTHPPAPKPLWTVPAIIGTAFAFGLLGVVYIEYSQGWRPGARRRRYG